VILFLVAAGTLQQRIIEVREGEEEEEEGVFGRDSLRILETLDVS
jgi:hypothetical protein